MPRARDPPSLYLCPFPSPHAVAQAVLGGGSGGGQGGEDPCLRTPEEVFKCMLDKYDACKAGVGPRTLCDYFDPT